MKARTTELLVAGVGSVALTLVAVHLYYRSKPATVPAAPPNALPVPLAQGVSSFSGAVSITLQPNLQTVSQALDVNTAVLLYLPHGARWVSHNGAPIGDTVSPQAFVFSGGPISHLFVWTDGTAATQSTTIYLTVAPPAGVVTA